MVKLGVGGVLHTPETIDSEQKRFVGSTFICEAANIDEVWEAIKGDIYYTTGVVRFCFHMQDRWLIIKQWDAEKIVVLPILVATPLAP
jgi:hypothetical protein